MARSKQTIRARSSKQSPSKLTWPAALLTTFAVGFAAAFLIATQVNAPDATESRIAELKAAEAQRDIAQIGVLTELAQGTRDRLTPVLLSMADHVPLTGGPVTPPTAATIKTWRETLNAEEDRYVETPSAGNGVNVARTALRGAVQQLSTAVTAFERTLDAKDPQKTELLELAATQRTHALRAWSVGALQLDVINVDAGKGPRPRLPPRRPRLRRHRSRHRTRRPLTSRSRRLRPPGAPSPLSAAQSPIRPPRSCNARKRRR
ncbi:hypothetical protein GCM10023148_03390 [Actinokineospora soli]